MKDKLIIMTMILLVSAGCKEKKAEQFTALPFPNVQIPSVIASQQEALEFMALNYWNPLTDPSRSYPSDSTLVSGVNKSEVEQKFADWSAILDAAGLHTWDKAFSGVYSRALKCERTNTSSNVFETFAELAQKYFYDPNSPMRDEEKYLHFVRRYAEYEGLTVAERGKYARQAKMCSLNRLGRKAADFRFSDKMGRMTNLYDIKSDLTLLFFSNPGCEACMDIINVLKGDPTISGLVAQGTLAVVNVYIDEDIQAWRSYMPIYPQEWYNGFDPDLVLRNNDIYNIRAIPSLYLLDSEKRVILKDAPENRIFDVLINY